MLSPPDTTRTDRPFPLMRSFAIYVLPLLLVAVVGLVVALRSQLSLSIETFFSGRELTTAEVILRTVNTAHPEAFKALVDGKPEGVSPFLNTELEELNISCFAILTPQGKQLFAGPPESGCASPSLDDFSEALETGDPILVEDLVRKGYWTTLGQVPDPQGSGNFLIAISRPYGALEQTIGQLSRKEVLVFGGLLVLGCAAMTWLVYRAQTALNTAFRELAAVRGRLEQFLSKSARETAISGTFAPERRHGVVMFADLRNFSGFAEAAKLEETASLIDSFVSVVTEAVEANDGDVDKMLGDGVLAWFSGDDAAERAIQSSIQIVRESASLPRIPGIGLYAGDVISVSLGHGARRDFTILGKVVNLASRLCSISSAGEITTPGDMRAPVDAGLELVRTGGVVVKNHLAPVQVSSYRLPE